MRQLMQTWKGKIRRQLVDRLTNERLVEDIVESEAGIARLNGLIAFLLDDAQRRNGTFIYDLRVAALFFEAIETHIGSMPTHTLQMGSGDSLGVDVLLVLSGVKEAWSIAPYPELEVEPQSFLDGLSSLTELAQLLGEVLPSVASTQHPDFSAKLLSEGRWQVGDGIVQHLVGRGAEATGLEDESVDFVWSCDVLEHVADPQQCIGECCRILRPGGVMAHQIDLRDHRDFSQPLRFLRESESEWQKTQRVAFNNSEGGFTNRWRTSEFVAAAEEIGFEVLEVTPTQTMDLGEVALLRHQLHADFQVFSDEDLSRIGLFLVARKPE